MTAQPTRTIKQSKVQNLLGMAADGCGGALNSLLVVLGDRLGLYATGQYSADAEERIVTQQWSAIPGEEHTLSVQREESAFMTLIGHECAAATYWPTGTHRSSQV